MATATQTKKKHETEDEVSGVDEEKLEQFYQDVERLQEMGINVSVWIDKRQMSSHVNQQRHAHQQDIKKLKGSGLHTIASLFMTTKKVPVTF